MNLTELAYLNPKSILDIGANVGDFSKACKGIWPDAEIFMIEANPECEPALIETGYPYKIALLSDIKKDVTFFQRTCGGTSTGDSIYRENTDWYSDDNLVKTKMISDTLSAILGDAQFDLIKADTQGSELDIFRGGESILWKAKWVLMEVPVDGVEPYNIGAPTRKDVMDYMVGKGFEHHTILEDICHPIHRYIIQQDILFTR